MKQEANGYKFETVGDEIRITFPSANIVYKKKSSVVKLCEWMLGCLDEYERELSGVSSAKDPIGGPRVFSPIGSVKHN